jgi:hypothetical protein
MDNNTIIIFPDDFISDASHQGIDIVKLATNALLRMRRCADTTENTYEMAVKIKNPECDNAKCIFEIEFTRTPKP